MKNSLVAVASLFLIGSLNAQFAGQPATYTPGIGAQTEGLYNNAMGSIADKLDKLNYEDSTIEGSPYVSNTFMPGQLFYGDEMVGNIYYRYNAYNEEIEIKQVNSENAPIRGLSKDKKIRLVANGKSMSFKTFIDKNGNTKNGYMTLLAKGDYKLYKHLKVTFREAKKAENSFVKSTPAKFSQSSEYYLEGPDGKRIDQIELNNKKIVQLVNGEKSSGLKSFIKENKLKVKDENGLFTIVSYLNGAGS